MGKPEEFWKIKLSKCIINNVNRKRSFLDEEMFEPQVQPKNFNSS